jgi:hypothetical protein
MSNWKEMLLDMIALICIFGVGYLALVLAPGVELAIIDAKGQ